MPSKIVSTSYPVDNKPEPQFVVALDPAIKTGWASGRIGKTPVLTTIRLKKIHETTTDLYGNAADWWNNQIYHLNTWPQRIDALAIENPISVTWGKTNHDSMAVAQGLFAIFVGIAKANGIRVLPIEVRSWRADFLGTAKLDRKSAKARALLVCKQLGWETQGDDNAADAAGIWSHACGLLKMPGLLSRMSPAEALPAFPLDRISGLSYPR